LRPMALIVTPGQLARRAHFYQQLSQLVAAGIPIISAFEMLSRNPPERSFHEPLLLLVQRLKNGAAIADSMQQLNSWIPEFDLALIGAGEKSGRLDVVFKLLAQHYDQNALLLRQMLSALAYPMFVLHFAIFLVPFLSWVKGGMSGFMYCV